MLVSDAERDETLELLREHHLAGRITSEELDDRVGRACAARTNADLDAAMAALPPRRPPVQLFSAPPEVVVPPTFVLAPHVPGEGLARSSAALSLGGLALLVVTLGTTGIVTLPMSIAGWVVARRAQGVLAENPGGPTSMARTAEVVGVLGAVLAVVAILLWFSRLY